MFKTRLPYKAEVLHSTGDKKVWWPVSANEDDNMVIGDGIPGDKKTAELCARCCNIAYQQAIEDFANFLHDLGVNLSRYETKDGIEKIPNYPKKLS